jgi:hypothetical protein
MVTPLVRVAFTEHSPREVPQWEVTGPSPQELSTHWAPTAPDTVTRHIFPEGQVSEVGAPVHLTVPQAAVWTAHLPPAQVACVRPVSGQLS